MTILRCFEGGTELCRTHEASRLLTHLFHAAKRYQRQIVQCENGLSGNAISTVSRKLQATFESGCAIAEGASFLLGLVFNMVTAD
jgi:hypothetical protein